MASVCSNVAANGGHDSGLSSEPAAVRASRRVLCCHYTPDGRFVLSGSEDTNIRVWKVPQSALMLWIPLSDITVRRRKLTKSWVWQRRGRPGQQRF